jgi:hypothetical protein
MTQSNNDIEELEELLTELEGQEAQLVRPYAEDDDAVTQLMDAPLGDQEWMVQVTALDRRMMSTDQVLAELRTGKLSNRTLVWRGGMDDWLPISRVDSLAGGVSQGGIPAPSGRLGAPAPLPASPMWATLPSAAPLPPPPTALPPVVSSGMVVPSSGASLGLPPAAAAPVPPPPSEPSSPRPISLPPPPPAMMSSSSNTARPVAIDFSEMVEDTSSPLRGKRAILALSAVAVLAVFLSVYALSSKSDGTATAATASTEQPHSVAALQPAMEKKAEPAPAAAPGAKPAEPVAAPTPAPKPAESELAANDTSASSGSSARTTAPARYSPRSEYRRRSRGGAERQDDSEASESAESPAPRSPSPRAAVAARAPAEEEAPASEPAAAPVSSAASDDADATEAPKSTGGKSNTFNREAAKAALAEAATQAKNCRPAGGPSGTGRVQVHYEPSGKVSKVDILTGKFENTTTGSCVVMLFRRAKVPEFTGAPVVTVSKSFEIP